MQTGVDFDFLGRAYLPFFKKNFTSMLPELNVIIREKQNIIRRAKRQLKRSEEYFAKHMNKTTTQYFDKVDQLSKRFDRRAKEISSIHEQLFVSLVTQYDEKLLKKETDIHKRTVIFPAIRKKIISEVCEYYGYRQEEIICEDRGERSVTECRQTIFYFFIKNQLGTLQEMADEVSRSIGSLINGVETITNLLQTDKYYQQNYRNLSERVEEIKETFLQKEVA